jgi:hypothetical protein
MAYRDEAYLAPPDFSKRFRIEWGAARARFLKIERRQEYNQAGDESFDAFRRGEHDTASRLLRESLLEQREMYAGAQTRGVALVRLRLIEEPLSDYLRYYEIPSYSVSEELGERIVFASPDPTEDELPDCIVFDSTVMFVNAYDGLGRLVGAIEVKSEDEIARHVALAERLLTDGEPRADYVRSHGL